MNKFFRFIQPSFELYRFNITFGCFNAVSSCPVPSGIPNQLNSQWRPSAIPVYPPVPTLAKFFSTPSTAGNSASCQKSCDPL